MLPGEDDGGEFDVTLDALQGMWKHSWGMQVTVRGTCVRLDNGCKPLKLKPVSLKHGRQSFELDDWAIDDAKSSADRIVWVHADGRTAEWVFEDEKDKEVGVDLSNIVHGKRKRSVLDYRKFDEQLVAAAAAAAKGETAAAPEDIVEASKQRFKRWVAGTARSARIPSAASRSVSLLDPTPNCIDFEQRSNRERTRASYASMNT